MLKNCCVYFIVETYYDNEFKDEAGFYPANTLTEAMSYIEEYFGDELSMVKHLELLDSSMLTMRPEVAKEILGYNFG